DTPAALKASLDTDFDHLQTTFDAALEKEFGQLRKAMAVPDAAGDLLRASSADLEKLAADHPDSFPVELALGRALKKEGQVDEAAAAFERAAKLVPIARGKGSPHEELAAIALERKDRGKAIAELTALVAVDFNNVDAARQLADQLRQANVDAPERLKPVYERIVAVDPFDTDAHVNLGRLALQRNE